MSLITKANRRVKKPAWQQGTKPPTKEGQDAFAIVANHEQKFTRAFTALLRDLITPEMLKTIRLAIREGATVESILDDIPFFNPDDPKTFAIWQGFAHRMERTYTLVVDEAIQNENRKRGWKIETLKLEPPVMPVNPSASQFVRAQALLRVVDISNKERQRLRAILTANMETGFLISRPSAVVDEIFDTVGLTAHQWERVNRKVSAAREAGMSASGLRELLLQVTDKVRIQRARTIARTETNDALSQGLTESWRLAGERGLTPPGTKKQWAAIPFDPNRSSNICRDLNGQEVGINENFSSAVRPGFTGAGPPAHPN